MATGNEVVMSQSEDTGNLEQPGRTQIEKIVVRFVSPHPGPLPKGEGERIPASPEIQSPWIAQKAA
jgi:hypothetical protein